MQLGIVYWVLPQLSADPKSAMGPQLFVCVLGVLIALTVTYLLRGLTASKRYDLLKHVPIVSRILTEYYQYEFLIGAASFLGVGHDLGAYCAYLASLPAGPLTSVGRRVTNELLRGVALPEALTDPLIPEQLVHLLAMGQEPELFTQSTAELARGTFAGLELRMNRLLAFVQPVMFLILGIQIVVMYANLLLPLYSVVERY
jgi:competence protein ComGB